MKPIYLLLFGLIFSSYVQATTPPKLQHAVTYRAPNNIQEYWVSEKLDGVRGYWNGQQLFTRQGIPINSPNWFTQYWPNIPLDGELWLGREKFEITSGCVRRKVTNHKCWQKMRFMIFDLPEHTGQFSQRVIKMRSIIANNTDQSINIVEQFKVRSLEALEQKLTQVITSGGEGLMLHYEKAYYKTGRSKYLMKLKRYQDAEAKVIAYIPGKGKNTGKMGALLVETATGQRFKIGSGFTDKIRSQPPSIGSIITYKFIGLTNNNIPRFASFLRVRTKPNTEK